jgi:hypothetical protein
MSVRVRQRPPVVNTMVQTTLVDESDSTSNAHSRVIAGIEQLEAQSQPRSKVTATLTTGTNVVNHGLGRKPLAVHVTPSVLASDFFYAMTSADAKQATIMTQGTTQTNCTLEFS